MGLMARLEKLTPLCFLLLLTLVLALSSLSLLPGQKKEEKTEEEMHREDSREFFKEVHCDQPDPAAVKAFAGCWKVGSIWATPSEKNLEMGMRMSEERAQLLIDSFSAVQAADSQDPRYCTVVGRPTVAPYPNAGFCCKDITDLFCQCIDGSIYEYTYVYAIMDVPSDREIREVYYQFVEEKITLEEYQKAVKKFAKKSGKYIRTFINMGPTHIWWDMDAEEDFWALPVPCDGWEQVEEKIQKAKEEGRISPERWNP
jgi:hypothetical protein